MSWEGLIKSSERVFVGERSGRTPPGFYVAENAY